MVWRPAWKVRAGVALGAFAAFAPRPAEATKCAIPPVHYIARCSEHRCEEGFVVRYRPSGRPCQPLPEVEEIEDGALDEMFQRAWTWLEPPRRDGVVQLTTAPECERREADPARCAADSSHVVLSTDPASLDASRRAWEDEAASAWRVVVAVRWLGTLLLVLALAAVLAFPRWVWRRRRHVAWLALPLVAQVPLALLAFAMTGWAHPEWFVLDLVLLATAAVLEVIELIWLFVWLSRRTPRGPWPP